MTSSRESGHALVESALALPLVLLLILGTLQLFMMLQARILAEYAVFRATRAGSVNMGDCRVMTHTAIAALLPMLERTNDPASLGAAFRKYRENSYSGGTGDAVVWLFNRLDEDHRKLTDIEEHFDNKNRSESRAELMVDLVFWYPLRIPYANQVIARMIQARWGLQESTGSISTELGSRIANDQYVVPIRTSFRMRLMTPAVQLKRACPNSPGTL